MDNIEKSILAFKLLNKNVRFININYHGGGDDGSIENIVALTLEQALEVMEWVKLPENYLSQLKIPHYYNGEAIGKLSDLSQVELDRDIEKIIEEISYEYLNNIEDWYNNDGGHGDIVVDIKTDDYHIHNNVYYRQSESYEHTGSFLSSS